ncbi:HAD family hydrolase [Bacillus sp. JJ722]|uniref:HAD family hydrolase n=1 Tax=Bacillus sp. JJ722 TaxID=3122973 RepID=UPI0030006F8A
MNYIFDFDGTLADSKECSILATQKAFEEMLLDIPSIEKIEYYMGIPIEQSFNEMANRALNEDEFQTLLKMFREHYKLYENDTLTVFAGIPHVLKQLKDKGNRLFVVSSKKSDVLKRNLQAIHIDTYFDDLIGSDKVSHYKPHPDGIFKLESKYQLDLRNSVMIGDAIFDIQMGKAAGCMTCAVSWGSHTITQLKEEQPTFCIDKVADLVNLPI